MRTFEPLLWKIASGLLAALAIVVWVRFESLEDRFTITRIEFRERIAAMEGKVTALERSENRQDQLIRYFHLYPPRGRENWPPGTGFDE